MRTRKKNNLILLVIISICFLLVLVGSINYLFSPSYKSKKVVEAFYMYEQKGYFSDSWELLHPHMKDRWSKSQFMTDRYHVFIGHFGTETFQFTIKESDKIKGWRMAEGLKPFDVTYKFTVMQTYKGKYGKFSFIQEVYVAKDKDDWKILWDYN